MAIIQNLDKLVSKFRALSAKSIKDTDFSVVVGFTARYAVYVHENTEMVLEGQPRRPPATGVYWGPNGQAKFLEQPARELSNDGTLGRIVAQAVKAKKTLAQGVLLAGLRLQRESQKLVPVVTGNLRRSAFTRLERGQG